MFSPSIERAEPQQKRPFDLVARRDGRSFSCSPKKYPEGTVTNQKKGAAVVLALRVPSVRAKKRISAFEFRVSFSQYSRNDAVQLGY